MTKCRGANLEAGRFFLTDDNDENVSKIIYADKDDDEEAPLWARGKYKTSQELRMLSLSLFIQGSLWMLRLLFSIARNVISVSNATNL